jgi:large subunit ribosomal protein L22
MKKATAQLNNLRVSPRKVRLVTDQIKGMQVDKALVVLEYNLKKPADIIAKLLRSAIANSENNFKLKQENLFIEDIQVGESKTLKRWMPRAYGRASKILKRTSKIKIFLGERAIDEMKSKKSVKVKKSNNIVNKTNNKNKKDIVKDIKDEVMVAKKDHKDAEVNKSVKKTVKKADDNEKDIKSEDKS